MRRFAKIARALGNRTTKQVASRLQKFFIKLRSAGMPVPGRIPKSQRNYVTKGSRLTRQALRPTTFFPANHVPFTINEDDDLSGGIPLDPNWYRQGCATQSADSIYNETSTRRTYLVDDDSDDDDNNTASDKNSLILRLLVRVKRDKDKDEKIERNASENDGFKVNIFLQFIPDFIYFFFFFLKV